MSNRKKLILVGDIIKNSNQQNELTIFDADNPTLDEVENLSSWLEKVGYEVEIETSINSFLRGISKRKNEIIFPLWRGGASRNRTAIIPAVCEAINLQYVGGDAYVQSICQDKALSKVVAKRSGIRAPRDIIIRSKQDFLSFAPSKFITPPFVVKPLYSACSIGVDHNSLCFDDEAASDKVQELFNRNLDPVVCEEFISGDEISLCIIEENGKINLDCICSYKDFNGFCPFKERLFTFDDKMNPSPPWVIKASCKSLNDDLRTCILSILNSFEKVDYLRIDGRICSNEFILIELTPDIHLGLESAFLGGFNAAGYAPEQILDRIIQTSLLNYEHQRRK